MTIFGRYPNALRRGLLCRSAADREAASSLLAQHMPEGMHAMRTPNGRPAFPSLPLCSVLGSAVICASSFFVAFSQKRPKAAATAPVPVGGDKASGQLQRQEQELAAAMADREGDAELGEEEHEGRPLLSGGTAAASSSPGRTEGGTSAWAQLARSLAAWWPAGLGGSRQGSTLTAVRAPPTPARRLSQGG